MNGKEPLSFAVTRRRRLRRLLGGGAAFLVLAAMALVWLFMTQTGLRAFAAVAARSSGGALRVEGIEGALHGPFSAKRLGLDLPAARLELSGLSFEWRPAALFSRKLALTRIRIEEAGVFLRKSEDAPSEPLKFPKNLRLPLDVELTALEIGRVNVVPHDAPPAAAPLFVLLEGSLSLAADAERFHLRRLVANLPQGRAEMEGELGVFPPHALRASGQLAGEAFSARLDAEGSLAEPLLRLRAQGGGAQGQATLVAAPFGELPLKTLEFDIDRINPALFASGLPSADIRIQAKLAANAANSEAALSGPVRLVNKHPVTLDAGGLPVSALSMEASLGAALDELRLDQLLLEGGGGRLSGWLRWHSGNKAAAKEDAARSGSDAVLPARFGRIVASVEAQGIDPARVDSRLPSRRVEGRLEMDADDARQRGRLSLHTSGMSVAGEGEVVASAVGKPIFVLKLDLNDFSPAAFLPASPPGSIKLRAAASGTLSEKPLIAAHYVFGESRFNGRPLAGRGLLTWNGAHVRDADIGLDLAGNRFRLIGAWGEPLDRLALELDAPRLVDTGFGLQGRLRASGVVTGGLDAPAGTLKADADRFRLPGMLDVARLAAEMRMDAGERGALALSLKASGLVAGDTRFAALRLAARGQRDRHQIQIEADGALGKNPLGLHANLEGGWRERRWQGRIAALESDGRWPLRLRAPAALEAGLAPEEFSLLDAEFDLDFKPEPSSGHAGRRRSAAAPRSADIKPGHLHLIETRWRDGNAVLRGKLSGLPATRIPGLEQGGRRSPLMLGADWEMRLGESVEGQARLFRESGDFSVRGELSTRLGLERFEAYLIAHQQKLTLALATHGREAGELGLRVEAGIERAGRGWRLAPQVPVSGAAHLDMPSLAWLGRLSRENIEVDGALAADITLFGTPDAPDLQGQIRGRGLRFSLVDQGLLLAGGQLEAGFAHRGGQQSLRLTKLEFESPNRVKPADKRLPVAELTATPGRLRVTGEIGFGAKMTDAQRGQFEFTAERLPLLQRPDRWLIVSGEGRAELRGLALDVQAQARADAGYIVVDDMPTPSLGDDVVVRSRNEEENAAPAAGEGIALSGKLTVGLGRALYLSAFGADTRLVGELGVELRPFEPPRTVGVIRTVGGTWRGYGQHLKIERGAITFQGEAANPAINITAMRRGLEVEAGVMITGDARHPQVKLVSEPAVPEHEKLSWLILGRAPDAGGGDMALLLPAAQALFGSTGGGLTEDIGSKLGFDTFSVGQGELNSMRRNQTSKVVGGGSRISAGPATESDVVTVGKRLTSDLSLSFEQSLGGAESLVKLTYRISRELSLIARGGTDNALDIYYTYVLRNKEWRERRRKRDALSSGSSPANGQGEE
ncbi:MAG: translocation/assembly module TamB domain-containing protein [Azoarcus sp.]|jgi:translocation and assembly module TamB|nr:translocation/assembly module TamB domain-containing protein [Azoarcus sp.]